MSSDGQTDAQFFGLVGATFRRFFADNMAYSVNASYVYRAPGGETTEQGGMMVGSGHYYQRLGDGMFVAPGFGLGFVLGDRNTDMGAGSFSKTSYLGVLRLQLPVVLYAWDKFNVMGGPEFLSIFGSTTPDEGEGTSFVRLDAGFSSWKVRPPSSRSWPP